jgi:hypothetical protein
VFVCARTAHDVPSGTVIEGSGIVDASSDFALPLYVDGAVRGISPQSPILMKGYIKGSGTFDNVTFDGIFSPGHSPTILTVGNTIYTASNVLIMELGGLTAGTQHDKIIHNGLAALDGTLDVTLINAFVPQLGNAFDVFDWNAGLTGAFATINLPALNAGLAWDTSDLYIGGQLVVTAVPEGSAFWLTGLCAALVFAAASLRFAWNYQQNAAHCAGPDITPRELNLESIQ